MTTLLEQRNKVIAMHKAMDSKPGSIVQEQPLSLRPVAFQVDEEIVVVGPCVKVVCDGLRKFAEFAKKPSSLARADAEHWFRMTVKRVTAFLAKPEPAEIRVGTQTWNCFAHALQLVNIEVVLTEGMYYDEV